ncbi:MAG: hypothetical protein ACYCV7_04545 [Acidimicrobiales bacterium]
MGTQMTAMKVPKFDDMDEKRAFWDAADIDDLADGKLAASEVAVAETPTVTISVRLTRADVGRLRTLAARRGQGSTTLARSWILERLAVEESGEDKPKAVLERLRADVEHLASALGG